MATQGKENLSVDGKSGSTPAPSPVLASTAEAIAQAKRRARRNVNAVQQTSFGRRLLNVLRNLAWVVPLTLLVWLFAEREQIRAPERMTVPVTVRTGRPDLMAALPNPSDRTISFDVRATRYTMEKARNALGQRGLELLAPSDAVPGKAISVPVADILANDPAFREHGLGTSNCTNFSPSTVTVFVDDLVTREFTPKAPASIQAMLDSDGSTIFDPPTVKLTGPRGELDNPERIQVVAEITPEMLPKDSGPLPSVPLKLLNPNDHITISPASVKAQVRVRSVIQYTQPTVAVLTMGPQWLLEKYTVVYPQQPAMPRVTFVGPADQINRIKSGQIVPKAYLEISSEDTQQSLPRTPTYVLPEGVKVSDKDKDRTIDFRLVPRSASQ